jgi:hypothetical protein
MKGQRKKRGGSEMKRVFWQCIVVGLILVLSLPVWAECPEGKSEILIVTPSGRETVICVPDNAIPGLENAADHSSGTIIPASCPCWDQEDIEYYQDNKMLETCSYDSYTSTYVCIDQDKFVILELWKGGSCVNHVTKLEEAKLTTEQQNICLKLLPVN